MKNKKFRLKYALGIPIAGVVATIFFTNTCKLYKTSQKNHNQQTTPIVKPIETRHMQGKLEAVVDYSPDIDNKDLEYKISKKGIDLIKEYEGFSDLVYMCPAGKKTIGYGHLVKDDENYKVISREEGERLLLKDIWNAEQSVKKLVNVPVNQLQYDALVSFVYNLGEGNFKKSTLLKKLNSRNYQGASEEFERWVYADGKKLKGLERRRIAEKNLFLEN